MFQLPLRVMVLAGFALFAGVVSGLISRGRFSNLSDIPMRYSVLVLVWLVGVALADRLGARIGGSSGNNVGFGLYLVGLAALVAFALINAVHMPGMWMIALGALANFVVCANNHGTPYSISALHSAGVTAVNYSDVATTTATKHPQRSTDQLKFLGDAVPLRVLKTVVSPGDLLFAFGLASVTANGLSGRRVGRRVRGVHRGRHLPKGEVPSAPHKSVPGTDSGVVSGSHFNLVTAVSIASAELSESPSAEEGSEFSTTGSSIPPMVPLLQSSAVEGSEGSTTWSARLDLLRATGDPEVLIDVTGGVAGPDDVAPAHALALALRAQNIPEDQVARLVCAAVTGSTASSGLADSDASNDLPNATSFGQIDRIELLELLSEV
jgi:Family of unknown function (DUF5317)